MTIKREETQSKQIHGRTQIDAWGVLVAIASCFDELSLALVCVDLD